MLRVVLSMLLLVTLSAGTGAAQTCTEEATIGNFDIEFEGAFFDGTNTEFTYCITGNASPALSHWALSLDLQCINPQDLVDCGPEPCFYQVNDPTTGITGIKWDETQVEPGETECFDFTLVGDWTASLGNVAVGLKAGGTADLGQICGPICIPCAAAIEVIREGNNLMMGVAITHNRPVPETKVIQYAIMNMRRKVVHRWEVGPITFNYLQTYQFVGAIPGLKKLPKGEYMLVMRLNGMSGWHWQTKPFIIK